MVDGFFLDDLHAEADAFVADIGLGAGDQFFNGFFGPSAKGTVGAFSFSFLFIGP